MKRKRIKQSLYRTLCSEMLPYELPLFLNNNEFYRLADRWRLTFDGDKVVSRRCHLSEEEEKYRNAVLSLINGTGINKKSLNYFIGKGDKERELVIVHPYMQLKMMMFYRKYESLILSFCQRSQFSLRYIDKRAIVVHPKKMMPKAVENEIDYKANEFPKHYFHYRKYQNINGFYEGKEFQRLESRFCHLFKTDIRHCFDDIPIDRLAEAIYSKKDVKSTSNCFAGILSTMMHEMNNGRKSFYKDGVQDTLEPGVVIGPEFSRLFAEMFLQTIDRAIEKAMAEEVCPLNLHDDYECFRYVDDIFFFYNNDIALAKFKIVLESVLKTYGMKINTDKNQTHQIPLITGVTKAKRELRLLIEQITTDRMTTSQGIANIQNGIYDFPLKMQSRYAIMDIKTILSSNSVSLKEVSSSMLAYLHRKLAGKLDKIDDIIREYKDAKSMQMLDNAGEKILRRYEKDLVFYVCELTKTLFYIFNNDMRMSTSIRVLTILNMAITFCKGILFDKEHQSDNKLSFDAQNKVFKTIMDEIHFTLRYHHLEALNGLEICNLLLLTIIMPRSFRISENDWDMFLKGRFISYDPNGEENVLMALTLLFLLGRDNSDKTIVERICNWLVANAAAKKWDVDDTECFLIITTMIPSPIVPQNYKEKIIEALPKKIKEATSVLKGKTSPFAQWKNFNLAKACQMKYMAEVY